MSDTSAPPPNPYPVAPAVPPTGGAGRVALILAIVLVALGIVVRIVSVLAPQIADDLQLWSAAIGLFFNAANGLMAVIAVVVVILGAVGIQPSQPRHRLAAAAGLGIGAAHLVSTLVGFVTPLVALAVL
jgi:hypothetical protein